METGKKHKVTSCQNKLEIISKRMADRSSIGRVANVQYDMCTVPKDTYSRRIEGETHKTNFVMT